MTPPSIDYERENDRLTIEAVERHTADESFATAVRSGLGAARKTLPCRFFYDARGSQIFEAICELPEYYPTRVERQILEDSAAEIIRELPEPVTLVELGSGSAAKTRVVIETLLARDGELVFVPIDISRSMLEASSHELLEDYPELEIRAIEAEYEQGLERLNERKGSSHDGARLILWLGSSIGNFDRPAATELLRSVRTTMRPRDRLLVGIDLRKDAGTLERAYDDAQGVTAEFNLNLLERINRDLGGSFELPRFAHRAIYDEGQGRVEMHLVSQCAQRVAVAELSVEFEFEAEETIHTENSYKYSRDEIETVATNTGLSLERQWTDRDALFSVNLLCRSGSNLER